ncbi:MAG: metallopeptidase family protein [Actinomycetaceae bacterium]|nr:metallopeptidase family protein [Actinomycetaceae bacterium]
MYPVTRRRDRHGRGLRGPLFHPEVPARLTYRQSFEQLVASNVQEIVGRLPELARIEIGIDEVPHTNPASWESHDAVMCRVFPENRLARLAPRLVLYRLPIQARAGRASIRDLRSPMHALIRTLLVENLSQLSGLSPEEIHGGPIGPLHP